MARYAEAECATCYAIRSKNEMREVRIERIVGKTYGSSSFSSSSDSSTYGTRHGGSNRSSTRTKIERLWVCNGCKAPRSDGWLGRLISRIIAFLGISIVVLAIYVASKGRPATPERSTLPDSIVDVTGDSSESFGDSDNLQARSVDVETNLVTPEHPTAEAGDASNPTAEIPADGPLLDEIPSSGQSVQPAELDKAEADRTDPASSLQD